MGQPLLVGTGIRKQFGGLVATDDVDIHVDHGEMVGLIGPNGSGKTTLFDCLTRVQELDAGRILLDGTDITHKSPHELAHLGLARTFQVIRVYRELSVLENMQLSQQWGRVRPLDMFRRPTGRATDRADQLLDFLLLTRLRDAPAGTLSGGQRRLLEIGMAMMSDPKVVLLDEATSGVNPSLVEEIKDRLFQLNRDNGTAMLLVEHDVRFVKDLCDRIVVLNQGGKLAEGTPAEIMSNQAVIEAYFGQDGGEATPGATTATGDQ